jgi:hypothetical protein
MKSKVYFSDLKTTTEKNLLNKLEDLLEKVEIKSRIKPNRSVAIKLHFGERGNTAFIRPLFLRVVVDKVKEYKGLPFLTDANTLYKGSRSEAVTHLTTAILNGFDYSAVGAPLIIADGIYGNTFVRVKINQQIYKEVSIAAEIAHADSLISVAHYKCHELSGFGGALKNIGMGCAPKEGKLSQHSNLCPKVDLSLCIGCGDCVKWCPSSAISLKNKKASFNPKRCIGCGECLTICLQGAIDMQGDENMANFQKKMVEYAYGVLKEKKGKAIFINFTTQVSPECDCYSFSDAPIVPDVGIVASTDPVALDQASTDLVNQQPGNPFSKLKSGLGPGEDKLRALFPEVDWTIQLLYAQELGLGQRDYELIKI